MRVKIQDLTSRDYHTLPSATPCISHPWAIQYGWVEADDDDWIIALAPDVKAHVCQLGDCDPGDKVFVLSEDIDERTQAPKYWLSEIAEFIRS